MKWTAFLPVLVMLFANEAFAQNQPTADECASLYPCPAPAAQQRHRRRAAPAKTAGTDPEVLRRLDVLEALQEAGPEIQVVPAPSTPCPPTAAPVVHNHVNVAAPSNAAEERGAGKTRFVLEVGGLASVHSSWWETSPGFYGAMRLRLGALALGVESGYQRIPFQDGSTVEDLYVEPVVSYAFGRRQVNLTLTAGAGFWTTREDWLTPICGRSSCGGENEDSLTVSLELGLLVNVVKNLEVSMGAPVRWVAKTPDGAEWTMGVRVGLGVFLPYP